MMLRMPEASTPPAQAALAEQPEHGGHQDQAGDAVVADRRVGGADVEVVEAVELRTGVQAFGEGVEVQACRERAGGQGFVILRQPEEFNWRPRTIPARTAASG